MKSNGFHRTGMLLLPLVLAVETGCAAPTPETAQAPPAIATLAMAAEPVQAPPRRQPPAPPAQPPASREADALTLCAAMSHANYSRSAPVPLLLKLDYATTTKASVDRPPLNIALVLDRSNSMAEEKKFPYALEAAREVIENLSERDFISLIAFNKQVLVLSPAGRVVNKAFLYHRLEDVAPEGFTDISAGLLEGIAQVNSQSAEGQIKQVLLLSDGKANHGLTTPSSFRNLVEKARVKGVGVSALGCGADFDEKLLTEIANACGGRYTYIRAPEQIPDAFREELRGLLEVVAQNVRLEISVEQGSITKVFGQLWDRPAPSHQISIGNLRAGERGIVLLAVQPSEYDNGAAIRVTAKLTFDDAEAAERVVRTVSAQAAFAPGGGQKADENEEVVIYGGLLNALEAATEGAEGFDRQRYRQALAGLAQWYGRARQFALDTRNQDLLNHTFLLKHLLEEMETAEKEGKLHEHAEAREKLKKETDYQRYLLFHHRVGEQH